MVTYSLVIPVYNEAKILKNTITLVHDYLHKKKRSYELIIADDGSVDNSVAIIYKLKKRYHGLKIVRNPKNQGRGSVLTKAFSQARGDILAYIDSDLSIDYRLFDTFVTALNKGYDIAIASKHLSESVVDYPTLRRIASKGYAFLVGFLFGIPIRDYQCGFKAFRKEVIKNVLPSIESKGWSWDTEFLIKAYVHGYKIKEFPATIVNVYERESTVHLLKDSYIMGTFVISLFIRKIFGKL